MITIDNWQQIVPKTMWEQFALEEARAVSAQVSKWVKSGTDDDMWAAHDARTEFLCKFIQDNNINTDIRNAVPKGLTTDSDFRLQLLQDIRNNVCDDG